MASDQVLEQLKQLTQRLEELTIKVDLLYERGRSPADDPELSAYPNQFITPKEALPFLKMRSVAGVYAACRAGQFKPGAELIDVSPEGSERPTYLINVRSYFRRLASAPPIAAGLGGGENQVSASEQSLQ